MRFLSPSSPVSWAALALALLPAVFGSALLPKRATGEFLGLNTNFPDPSFMLASDGKWYAYGTNGNGKRIQVATSNDFNTWTLLDIEALPTLSTWETDRDHWAPDVVLRVSLLIFRSYEVESAKMEEEKEKQTQTRWGEAQIEESNED